ncbi:hypothetical protein RHOFW104R3_17155 [Rhodanobacter denitrificans]|nr:hypothetical protein RHOFW104R3_17155 [Rhodanobacter denitrificans]
MHVFTLSVQMSITQQSIQCLQRRADALRTGPPAGDIDQGQTTAMDQCFHGTQQHATAQCMHRLQCLAQALLQYFGGAHGVVSSGFVTRED